MRITVFTGNHPRHLSLIHDLSSIADTVHAVTETTTIFTGSKPDFYAKSDVMQRYFNSVRAAEQRVFGAIRFTPANAVVLAIRTGDLSSLHRSVLEPALRADAYVVFGASYIKGWLVEHLVDNGAISIHMGVSPYYRGSSCNFWALYDRRPELVGATIHRLSTGLDSGPMLYHALPNLVDENPFEFTMKAVKAAHTSLTDRIASGEIFDLEPLEQDKNRQVRYSRYADFDDAAAAEFLERSLDCDTLRSQLSSAPEPDLLRAFRY